MAEVRANPNEPPSLEYDFVTAPDWNGAFEDNTHIWVRSQRGGSLNDETRYIYWAVYRYDELYDGGFSNTTPLGTGQIETIYEANTGLDGPNYGGADGDRWRWRALNNGGLNLDDYQHYTLAIWAGSPGYDLDQIVIGNRNDTAFTTDYNGGAPVPNATPGSAFRQACNRCNPIYGLTVNPTDCGPAVDNGWNMVSADNTNLLTDDLFSGYQPVREVKETLKYLASRLDPHIDQVGLAGYATTTPDTARVELRCARHDGDACFQGSAPLTYTETLHKLEILPPDGSTNMAGGMLRGLQMLGIDADNLGDNFDNSCIDSADHCSRGNNVRRVMVLITDGIPNYNPRDTGETAQNCYIFDSYQPDTGHTDEDRARDCVMFYGQIAANAEIDLYAIALGDAADEQLLQTLTELPGLRGKFYAARTPDQLRQVIDDIMAGRAR